jgi:hypothetical protein
LPYRDNTWYHVTDAASVAQIAVCGLVGSGVAPRRVWDGLAVEEGAVYLWPTAGLAYTYAKQSGWKRRWPEPTLLRIRGIDRLRLAPDHEQFQNHYVGEPAKKKLAAGCDESAERLYGEVRGYVDAWDMRAERRARPSMRADLDRFSDGIEILRRMPQRLRQELARHLSEVHGEPVMHYGPIVPEQIEVGERLRCISKDNGFGEAFWPEFEDWRARQPTDLRSAEFGAWKRERAEALAEWVGQQRWCEPELFELAAYAHLVPAHDELTDQYTWIAISAVAR